jgi:DNA polymerase-3 subunit delta
MKNLCAALKKYTEDVEFCAQAHDDLIPWVIWHFKALGKEIDRQEAEYLIFLCGDLMTGLAQEIGKIAAYVRSTTVTRGDIDAVADPVLSAEVFKLSDAVVGGCTDKAAEILGDLLKMQTDPIMVTAALGSQLRRLYTARLALDGGRDRLWLMNLWGYRSDYPVKLLLSSAGKTSREWCADAVKMCQTLDRRLKSERSIDGAGELKLLLVKLEAQRKP